MARKRRTAPHLSPVPPPASEDTVTMPRGAFQALHSAARAMYRQAIQTDNHSAESLVYLQLLDAAIDAGHEALGTQRPYADQYVHIVRGLTEIQLQNARKILEGEGLLDPQQDA